jgi:organic hydroperoxide reductase OsmC/OhrA
MSQISIYSTQVVWKGEHWGHLSLGNGPEMEFSAPPDAQGHPGVFTPEDAFVAAVNTCIMMMFLWAVERFKIKLLEYECRAEGYKRIEFDRTEIFDEVRLWPLIRVDAAGDDTIAIRARLEKALRSAQKYSLIANSVKSKVTIDPSIEIV